MSAAEGGGVAGAFTLAVAVFIASVAGAAAPPAWADKLAAPKESSEAVANAVVIILVDKRFMNYSLHRVQFPG